MRRVAVLAALGGVWLLVARPAAQQPAPPPASGQVFRTGVDVIRIDVTVLDKNRKPVRGLTADDFTVRENGRPQRIVTVAEVSGEDADPTPSAWMRYAPRDVTTNDLADQLGDGEAIAIVLDDFTIPDDSNDMTISTREVGRLIVNSLGPSDIAAVVFPFKAGRTEDFTHDRVKLLAAVDRFEPEQPMYRTLEPQYPSQREGDIRRYSPVLGRDPCFQLEPVIPTLRSVTARLATVPNRRKALFFVSVGLPTKFTPGRTRCQGLLYDEMRRMFETAQRFNVNIHAIDPAGAAGYQRFLQQPRIRNARLVPARDLMAARGNAQVRHDFLELLTEQTGGHPVVASDDIDGQISDIFEEYSSYYLLGYETTNGDPDGKFRRLEVEVNRKDVEVRTKIGRWAPDKNSVVDSNGPRSAGCFVDCYAAPPRGSEVELTGLRPYQPLKVRAVVYPIARAAPGSPNAPGNVDVAAAITIRLPALVRPVEERLTLTRITYDAAEKGSPPVQEFFTRQLEPTGGDETQYDILSRFSLPPGRHEVRFSASSRIANVSGSVNVEIEVPDLTRTAATASTIVLGRPDPGREDLLAALIPVVPTTARDFTASDRVTAFLRFFTGGSDPAAPVEIATRLLRSDGTDAAEIPPATLAPDAFNATHSADYSLGLPLANLKAGLHLLSVTATFDQSRVVRRDLVFRIR